MKIRTDFVTNSSSSSYISFRVQSKYLTSLLEDFLQYLNFSIKYHECVELEINGDSFSLPFFENIEIGIQTPSEAKGGFSDWLLALVDMFLLTFIEKVSLDSASDMLEIVQSEAQYKTKLMHVMNINKDSEMKVLTDLENQELETLIEILKGGEKARLDKNIDQFEKTSADRLIRLIRHVEETGKPSKNSVLESVESLIMTNKLFELKRYISEKSLIINSSVEYYDFEDVRESTEYATKIGKEETYKNGEVSFRRIDIEDFDGFD